MKDFKKEFYTVPEVAELFGVSAETVYRMTRKGELSYYQIGNQKRIAATELEKLKHEGK